MLDESFEIKVLACLYRSSEFCAVACQHLKAKYFDDNLRHNMCKMSLDFYSKYKTTISNMGFVDGVKNLLDKKIILPEEKKVYIDFYKRIYKEDISDYKYVLDKLISFIKQQELKLLIEQAVTQYIPNEDYESIEARMRKISNITNLSEVQPVGYIDTIDDRFARREEEKKTGPKGLSTGIDALDELLGYRGWQPGELYIIGGSAKAGKSQSLLYFSNFAAKNGCNVAYFTLEVSTDVICDRADAMNSQCFINDLSEKNDVVVDKLKNMKYNGNFWVFDYPARRCTVGEIERQIKKQEIENGIRFDLIAVDYIGIMKLEGEGDDWKKLEICAEELRALAKIYKVPILTAAQFRRTASNKKLNSGVDLAGSYGLLAACDGLLSLSATSDEKLRGELTIRTSEFRNAPDGIVRIKTNYACGTFFDSLIDDEIY